MSTSKSLTLVAAALTLTLGVSGAVIAGEDPDNADRAAALRATEELPMEYVRINCRWPSALVFIKNAFPG